MAEKHIWAGSFGPYVYQDDAALGDPEAILPGTLQCAVVTDGQLYVEQEPTEDEHVVRKADLELHLPAGVIVLWSGSIASIPTGWLICDGTNGTPDLRDRFILGAGTTAVSTIGGANSVDLSHTHTVGSFASDSGGSHNHALGTIATVVDASVNNTGAIVASGVGITVAAHTHTHSHNHTMSGVTGSGGTAHTHTISGTSSSSLSTTVENRPPFYALAYIMKT